MMIQQVSKLPDVTSKSLDEETTYESIAWCQQHYGKAFKNLSNGRRIQISKHTNDIFPQNDALQQLWMTTKWMDNALLWDDI